MLADRQWGVVCSRGLLNRIKMWRPPSASELARAGKGEPCLQGEETELSMIGTEDRLKHRKSSD